MSDLLSASSLLLTIAAILFSLWYPDISNALQITPNVHSEDNVGARTAVTSVILSKALPVAIVSAGAAIIFIPDTISIVKESLNMLQASGYSIGTNYDAVKTAYCFVTICTVALASYMWTMLIRLWNLRKHLGQ